ncbi:MAG: tetratricopeptide repeat protein [Streptosporangiales bacterium]|nr:tetratricopeptide repeat protein [Streptosporangiales bacterium]
MGESGDQEGLAAGSRGSGNEAYAPGAATVLQIGHVSGDVVNTSALGLQAGAGPAEPPRQVPAPPASFVDRILDLAWLSNVIPDPEQSPRIVVLEGLGGVGKRSAVRRWAHRVPRDRFPGGHLYVDCAAHGAGAGEGTADVSGMLGACLRAYRVDPRFLPSLRDRAGEFRTRTSSAPVLVVVENATEPAQVRALVPACPGSLVLVTTSADLRELLMNGARFRELGGLDDASATELLEEVCGPERIAAGPGGAADLVRWCAGLPIAVAVLAARLAGTSSLTVAELAAELADEARRLSGLALGGEVTVSAVFTSAYEGLPEPARRLYRLLGTLPCVDASPATVAAVAGLEERHVRAGLDALVTAHLAEFRGKGRYGLHELARLHARERARDEDDAGSREAALRTLVSRYVVRAAFADRAVMGPRARVADHRVLLAGHEDPFTGPDSRDKALAWLNSERANFVPVSEAAAAAGWNADTWQLAEALTGYYYNRRHLSDWVTVSGTGALAARACGNTEAEARVRMTVSRAYTDLGDLGRARAELDAAAALADGSGNAALQASCWEFRGRYLDAADPSSSFDAYQRSYELNMTAGEQRGAALALYFAGAALETAGQHEQALETLGRALGLLRDAGDGRMAGRALIAIGSAQASLGREGEAAASLQEALGLVSGLHYEAQAREALAGIAEKSGDRAAARDHLREAARIYGSTGHPRAAEIAARLGDGSEPS